MYRRGSQQAEHDLIAEEQRRATQQKKNDKLQKMREERDSAHGAQTVGRRLGKTS